MKRRLVFVTLAFALFGIAFALRPIPKPMHRSEAWLQDSTPTVLDGYTVVPGPNGDRQTYRMPASTYELINAYGIDSLIFTNGTRSIDVCVIAGNDRESFHDPYFCFPGSGWAILNPGKAIMPTKTRGSIPFSVLEAKPPTGGPRPTAYTYKGPTSMVTSEADLYMQWSWVNFISGQPHEGAFYRFIGDEGTSQADLLAFAADFMDAIKKTSGGVL